uniref:PlsC domain-containing protein n=1 Tax=Rhodnius prolixus TaxID=13249 RepID=T1HX11_RHOPR
MIFYIYKLLRAVLRVVLIVINNVYVTIPYCIWVILTCTLIKPINKDLYIKIEEILYGWLVSITTFWSWSAGYQIVEMGDVLTPCTTGKTLLLVNHQSTADVPMLMALFNENNYIKRFMWIMDWIFCVTHFGTISYLHGDVFILSGSHVRQEAKRRLKHHILTSFLPLKKQVIILFPEGGFLRKRRELSKRYALEHNITNTIKNVALPRTGAFHTIVEVLRRPSGKSAKKVLHNEENSIKWVLDVTLAYENGIPLDLLTIMTGWRDPCKMYVLYRLFPATEIPEGDANITKWLYNLWEEKDKILQSFYNQEIPLRYCPMHNKGAEIQNATEVKQNTGRLIFANVFYLLSAYFHFHIVLYFVSLMW